MGPESQDTGETGVEISMTRGPGVRKHRVHHARRLGCDAYDADRHVNMDDDVAPVALDPSEGFLLAFRGHPGGQNADSLQTNMRS